MSLARFGGLFLSAVASSILAGMGEENSSGPLVAMRSRAFFD